MITGKVSVLVWQYSHDNDLFNCCVCVCVCVGGVICHRILFPFIPPPPMYACWIMGLEPR